jgi:hypothetical protein
MRGESILHVSWAYLFMTASVALGQALDYRIPAEVYFQQMTPQSREDTE